jgi:hypothetical protein
MYQASKKGTSTWGTITKEQFELYSKAPYSRIWKVKHVAKTAPLKEVTDEKKATKKKA